MTRAARNVAPALPSRYAAIEPLHRSENSEVWRASNREDGTEVALKLLRVSGPNGDVAREMFVREVESLTGLDHDGIVRIVRSFETDEILGIELELVHGGKTLSDLVEAVGDDLIAEPDFGWRIDAAAKLVDAVASAHARDVIHRDLKPGNVLWARDAETHSLKLSDFGIAAILPLIAQARGGTTLRSFFTAPFASPEQLLQRRADFSSDVYSLALVLVVLLTMRPLDDDFEPENLGPVLDDLTTQLVGAGLDRLGVERLVELLRAAVRSAPSARPTISAIAGALSALQSARPTLAEQATFRLLPKPRQKLAALGFHSDSSVANDLNDGLRISCDRDERGEFVCLYGRTLFILLRNEHGSEFDRGCFVAVDAGCEPGPAHDRNRSKAHEAGFVVSPDGHKWGLTGMPVVRCVRAIEARQSRHAKNELLALAQMVIDIEKERIPFVRIRARVLGGVERVDPRETAIGVSAGYQGAQSRFVTVNGEFRLGVDNVTLPRATEGRTNSVAESLAAQGVEHPQTEAGAEDVDWTELFDDLRGVDLLTDGGHPFATITGYHAERREISARLVADGRVDLPVVGNFVLTLEQDRRQLKAQENALQKVLRNEAVRADLGDLLTHREAHRMGERPWVSLLQADLRPPAAVAELVDLMIASESIFCLKGPPGTGKTTVIAELVAQYVLINPTHRVLIASQANEAVANAVQRVLELRRDLRQDWIVARDARDAITQREGEWSGMDAAYARFRDETLARMPADAPAAANLAHTTWRGSLIHRSPSVDVDFRGLVQIWGTTVTRAERPLRDLAVGAYDLVIIDEAAKATVAEVLLALVYARRAVLVGDERQLPPFLESTTLDALKQIGVTEQQAKYTLFEHLANLLPKKHVRMLDTQFRMHPSIGSLVSDLFYDGKVRNGKGTENRPLPTGAFAGEHRVIWLDVDGRDRRDGRTSRRNDEEVDAIVRGLDLLDADLDRHNRSLAEGQEAMRLSVAVIAAYRAQADVLARRIDMERRKTRWSNFGEVRAATVDSFQGRDADVVLYSMVRTGSTDRSFIADDRRFNVALSRAKRLLVIFGDMKGAHATPRLRQLLDAIPPGNRHAAESFLPEARQANRRKRNS